MYRLSCEVFKLMRGKGPPILRHHVPGDGSLSTSDAWRVAAFFALLSATKAINDYFSAASPAYVCRLVAGKC